jgi:pyruvate-formate lyase-activating enzyme
VPIVPGYNDTVENLQATAAFMAKLNLKEVNLLPFHRLGRSKYEQLGLNYKYGQVPSPSSEVMRSHQRVFEAAGLQCYVGSETPF